MVGGFIGATVVTLLQFVRVRDRRLLLLAAMFAFQAQALARECGLTQPAVSQSLRMLEHVIRREGGWSTTEPQLLTPEQMYKKK